MARKLRKIYPMILIFSILLFPGCEKIFGKPIENEIFGYVQNEDGPVQGAIVRIQATELFSITNELGYFQIKDQVYDHSVIVTAWSEGHYIGWVETTPASFPIVIPISKYSTSDNLNYDWSPDEGGFGSIGCAECHPAYDEWLSDAHSQSAVNPRFLTMYSGADLDGNISPPTQYGFNRDYGTFQLRPDPDQPYYGPGYKLDFPDSAGNCATCHVPAQAAYPGKEYTSDPLTAANIEVEGIFCNFCHKIGDVILDPQTGLPRPNMPGVLSIQLFRPADDAEELFLGNFDDVAGPDSYLPLYEQSAYCAPCHSASFWDVTVYNSYGEWLNSPYSHPQEGQTCQECHMPAVDYEFFVYPNQGGVRRDPQVIRDHNMTGFMEETLMENAVTLDADASIVGDQVDLVVSVFNDQTGHAVPTDHPLRQVILLVEARGNTGKSLELIEGSTIPFYGGVGDPSDGYYAGQPGKIYMKVLQEIWTEFYPSGAYWNPTRVMSDKRLIPFEEDKLFFSFSLADAESIEVRVRLMFRRATKELMDQKDWDVPDILMEQVNLSLQK